jgi:hypothetical protein
MFGMLIKEKFINKLVKTFPGSLSEDVKSLGKKLLESNPENIFYQSRFWRPEKDGEYDKTCIWTLNNGEKIYIPFRVHFCSMIYLSSYDWLSEVEKIIFHCIFSRSGDGFAREGHLRALLRMGADKYEWVKPYIISAAGEYVVEIVDMLYKEIDRDKISEYREICKLNFEITRVLHARMIAYWSGFYRFECYYYKDYVGKKLFSEIFGMRKSGQKIIEINDKI